MTIIRGGLRYMAYPMCQTCGGSGQVTIGSQPYDEGPEDPITCPSCLGDGDLADSGLTLRIHSDPDLFESYKIYEAIDNNEYIGLSSPNEDYIDAITGLSLVDLSEGSRAKTILWGLFDSESITRTNLIALIGG